MKKLISKILNVTTKSIFKIFLIGLLNFFFSFSLASDFTTSEEGVQQSTQIITPKSFHVIWDSGSMARMKEQVKSQVIENKCPNGTRMQNISNLTLETRPEKASEDSRCAFALTDPKGYFFYTSPVFRTETCAQAYESISKWAENIFRGRSKEGKHLDKFSGDDCSNYVTQTIEIKAFEKECTGQVKFEVRLGPLRDSLRFHFQGITKRKWLCSNLP